MHAHLTRGTHAHVHAHVQVLFPLFPAETVNGLSADPQTRLVAQASAKLYANLACGTHYPQPPFETCTYAGWGALTAFSAAARATP